MRYAHNIAYDASVYYYYIFFVSFPCVGIQFIFLCLNSQIRVLWSSTCTATTAIAKSRMGHNGGITKSLYDSMLEAWARAHTHHCTHFTKFRHKEIDAVRAQPLSPQFHATRLTQSVQQPLLLHTAHINFVFFFFFRTLLYSTHSSMFFSDRIL